MAMVQVLCARNQVWLAHEKGALALAGTVLGAPEDFAKRVNGALLDLDLNELQRIAGELGAKGVGVARSAWWEAP